MAAPPEKTVKDLSGKWTMNKTLSGDFDAILAFQGIGWLTRKAIGLATVTLHITQYSKDGKVHVDIIQKVTGGINATPEFRIFDWEERPHKDGVFGDVRGRSRFVKVADMESGFGGEEKEFLGQGWDESADTPKIESYVVNGNAGWTAIQIWGFQVIEGKRYYCRNIVVKKAEEKKTVRLVYDYVGPVEESA